jgi:hypothetical protein
MVLRGMLSSLSALAAGLCLCTPPAPAQVPGEVGRSVVADGGTCLIAKSRLGMTLFGYSIALGKRVHSISGHAGQRAIIGRPVARGASIGPGRTRIDDGPRIHLVSSVTGEWSTVNLGVDKE